MTGKYSSKLPRSKINDLDLVDQRSDALHEVGMCRVFFGIIVSIRLLLELDDEAMREAVLRVQQPINDRTLVRRLT